MAGDIRTSELRTPVDVAEYLFKRLYQVGVRGVHGVPGDYNLVRLFLIPNCNGTPKAQYLEGGSRLHTKNRSELGRQYQRTQRRYLVGIYT